MNFLDDLKDDLKKVLKYPLEANRGCAKIFVLLGSVFAAMFIGNRVLKGEGDVATGICAWIFVVGILVMVYRGGEYWD